MTSAQSLLAAAMIVSAIVAVLTATYTWRRRAVPGAVPFILLMLAVAEWATVSALEHLASDYGLKLALSKAAYLGIVSVAPCWLLFALAYGRQRVWLAPRRVALLFLAPLVHLVLVFTNESHHWVWRAVTAAGPDPAARLVYHHGPAVWVFAFYSYSLLLIGTVRLALTTLRASPAHHGHAWVLVASAGVPWVANALYLAGVVPQPGVDLTPVAFALTGLAMAWGIFRMQMLDLVPVARGAVVEGLADGVFVVDVNGRVIDANPAACALLGRTFAETFGQRVESVLERWMGELRLGDGFAEIHAEVGLEGARWLDLSITPLRARRGEPAGRLIVLRDVTARKQVETSLERHARELEARNAELDAFARTVAHNLKSPLASIVGYASLLEAGWAGDSEASRTEAVLSIRRGGERMARIVDELLLLASLRTGTPVRIGPLDIGALVAEALEGIDAEITARRALVTQPTTWPPAVGYGPWVVEIWANYLSNALKYGGEPPRLELGCDELATRVRYWVRDNGAGLTDEEQGQLFVEFTRLQQVGPRGHGLGLSIVRRIVERLGGEAGVVSSRGAGSLFYFTLPREVG